MRVALFFYIFMSAGLSAVALYLGGYPIPALIALALGILWIFGLIRSWKWVPALGLIGTYALVVTGLLRDCSSALMIAAAFFALLAWDLADFTFRLSLVAPGDETLMIRRRHLLIISLVALVGAGSLVFGLKVKVGFTFEWMALLLLFTAWGVGRIVGGVLRHTQHR